MPLNYNRKYHTKSRDVILGLIVFILFVLAQPIARALGY